MSDDVTVVKPGSTAWNAMLRAHVTTVEYCEENGHTYSPPQPVEGTDMSPRTVNGVDVLECKCCGHLLSDPRVSWFRRPGPKVTVQPTTEPA